jgi:predicted metal-dependent enzyme (double-stranded beta helix superfamily)
MSVRFLLIQSLYHQSWIQGCTVQGGDHMDVDQLVADCREAVTEVQPRTAVRTVLDRALADRQLADSLGPPVSGLNTLYRSTDLTVLNVVWPPRICLFPHDHRMWAAIGIYRGREDNAYFRRQGRGIISAGGKTLTEGDVLLLGDDAIHSVENPVNAYTGAIHVYGGDFFDVPRSQWDAESLEEEPYDIEAVRRQFELAERESKTNAE